MTKEEHIARLEIIKNYLCAKKDIESMTYAIETLKQEPKTDVLEQIREKVKQYYDRVNEITDMSVFEKGQSLAYDTVLAIIDKAIKEQNE